MPPTWISQGPSRILNGQVEGLEDQVNPVAGAVTSIVPHPYDSKIFYIGAVRGGVWKTIDGTTKNPTWTPLTETLPSLTISTLELDPTVLDRANTTKPLTLIAGIGRLSSFSGGSSTFTGLLRSTDDGNTWTEIGKTELDGRNIAGVAARGDIIMAASRSGGFYRSTDGGASFEQIDNGATALPKNGLFTDLVADPVDSKRFYTAALNSGIFRSDDNGDTWKDITSNIPGIKTRDGREINTNIKLAVHKGSPNVVYAAVVSNKTGNETQGNLSGVFRSDNFGERWTSLGVPTTKEKEKDAKDDDDVVEVGVHPGNQGAKHFSFAADPTDPNIVYVGGDRQPKGFNDGGNWPNSIGAKDYSGRLFKWDGSQWTPLTHNFAGGTAPHADSRDMVFDRDGNLIEVDDTGIYKRANPTSPTGEWSSLNGDLRVSEFHSVDWDANSGVILAGAQDAGTSEGKGNSSDPWQQVTTGDGGRVAVDDSDPNQSIRYSSYQKFGNFQRRTFDKQGVEVKTELIKLIVKGTKNKTLQQFDRRNIQFYGPFELNKVDPQRLVLGTANIYESSDRGDNITKLDPFLGAYVGALAYGGESGGVANPDILYVGAGNKVFVRQSAKGDLKETAYSGKNVVRDIVLDPNDWRTAYALSEDNVFITKDAGAKWESIASDLFASGKLGKGSLQTIEYLSAANANVLLVGGLGGVYYFTAQNSWTKLGDNLPNANVYDLRYDSRADVLVAGTLGRGAWTIPDASVAFGGSPPAPPPTPTPAPPGQIFIADATVPERINEYVQQDLDTQELDRDVDDDQDPPEMEFTVTLSAPSDVTVTVAYTTVPGTATPGVDYEPVSGVLIFEPGQTIETIVVPVLNDAVAEDSESFSIRLSNAVGANIIDGEGIGTLLDEDSDLAADFDDFSNVSALTLNGNAAIAGDLLRLVPDAKSQVGSAFLTPVALEGDDSFTTHFRFRLQGTQEGDGFAFVIRNAAANVTGLAGGYLGYQQDLAGTPYRSLAVEFDTHQNTEWGGDDPNIDHIAVLRDGSVRKHLAVANPSFDLNSGTAIDAWIDYDGTTDELLVYLARGAVKPTTPLLRFNADLPAIVGANAVLGITGATGDASNAVDIGNWEFALGDDDLEGETLPIAGDQTAENFANFANSGDRLVLNGNATIAGDLLRLVPDQTSQSASVFLPNPFEIGAETYFETRFQFRISGQQGANGADGFTFLLKDTADGMNAAGWAGGYLGYFSPNSLARSLAVEFDTHQNEWDVNDNHVAVLRDGSVTNQLAIATPSLTLDSGAFVNAWVEYDSRSSLLQVFLSSDNIKPANSSLSHTINLADTVGGEALVGFTAATGANTSTQDIQNWQFTLGSMIVGDASDDYLDAFRINDKLFGEAGNDILDATDGLGNNRLYGGDGNDTLYANTNDQLYGDSGNDILFAGEGGNTLTGGAGADRFNIVSGLFPNPPNTIADFELGRDLIGISGVFGVTNIGDLTLTQQGSNTLIAAAGYDLAVLVGIQSSTLTNKSFVFS